MITRARSLAFALVFAGTGALSGCGGGSSAGGGTVPTQLLATVTVSESLHVAGKRADYTLVRNGAGYTLTDNVGNGGTLTLTTVKRLHFSDISVALDLDGTAGKAYRIYQAAFNRVPDIAGLGFWIDGMDKGLSLNEVAAGFVRSAEFAALYGASPSNAAFVTKIYENVLHRAPEMAGYLFWLDVLDRKGNTPAEVLALVSESAENVAGVAAAIAGGIAYASGDVAAAVLSGTAATGSPIVGRVTAIDINGKVFYASTSALGAYSINVAGGSGPFLLTVTGQSVGKTVTLNSVATAIGQTVNITPLTDLIVATAAGQASGEALASLCTSGDAGDQGKCKNALLTITSANNLGNAVSAVSAMIAPLNPGQVNPLSGAFLANGSGMDALLDQILVTPAAGQQAMATVTLVAVPGQLLGSVTLPPLAGGTALAQTVTPPAATVTAAASAQSALTEIRACMSSFAALYPATMSTPPSTSAVSAFIDASFTLGGPGSTFGQAGFSELLSTLATDGTGGIAQPGFALRVRGLSPFDFSVRPNADSISASTSGLTASSAWVQLDLSSVGGGMDNWKMIKGAAYAGCAGGWRLGGNSHVDLHMNARVRKVTSRTGSISFGRELPMHIDTERALMENIGSVVVSGPGLYAYSGIASAPLGAARAVTLVTPPPATAPAVRATSMGVQLPSGELRGEAIQTCQDLAANGAATGTPCYDERAVAPGAVFTYTVYGPGAARAGAVLYAFPFQIGAVPLSLAFVKANEKDLFAQNISVTPLTPAALNIASAGIAAGAALDGIITFRYSESSVYGARPDNCGIGIGNASNQLTLIAEQDATGQPTSCTFKTSGLFSGSLAKPAAPFGGTFGYIYVGNTVLGNHASSTMSY